MNDTLRTTDGRTVLRPERRLPHPPAKVWRAITEREHLNRWFPCDVEVDLRLGAPIRFVEKAAGPDTTGTVTELDPPRVFAFSWEADHVHWEIRPDGAHSVLILHHSFDDRAGAAGFATGWTACIVGLDQVLTGQPVEPATDMTALHEEYVAALGLDTGTVEDIPDGRRVRVEQRSPRAPDRPTADPHPHRTDGRPRRLAGPHRPGSPQSCAPGERCRPFMISARTAAPRRRCRSPRHRPTRTAPPTVHRAAR